MLHPNKFLLKGIYGLEDVVALRIPNPVYAWPSLISEWNDLSNSGSPFYLDASHQVSAQEDVWFGRRYCLKY